MTVIELNSQSRSLLIIIYVVDFVKICKWLYMKTWLLEFTFCSDVNRILLIIIFNVVVKVTIDDNA